MPEFLARSLDTSTIFLIAGLGELIGQRSGVLNVGIEGVMLFGATLGFITAQTTGSYLLGFLVAIAIGGLLGLLHGFFSITLGGDQVVSGMGIWILGLGLTTYIGSPYTGPLGLERIPTIFGLSPFFYVGIALAVITWFVLFKTSLGLKIRSVGENPAVAEVSGISVAKTRYLTVIIGGMLMGFAGAIYSLDYNPGWSYNFLLGWGFMVETTLWYAVLYLPVGLLLLGVQGRLANLLNAGLWTMSRARGEDAGERPEGTKLKTAPIIAAAGVAALLTAWLDFTA